MFFQFNCTLYMLVVTQGNYYRFAGSNMKKDPTNVKSFFFAPQFDSIPLPQAHLTALRPR